MSKGRINIDYVSDILHSIYSIEKFVIGYSYEDFIFDEKTYEAVIRKFGIIGEAANKLSPDFRDRYPFIPWANIIGMRHKVIHAYFGVDLSTIWDTIHLSLPEFKKQMEEIYNSLNDKSESF